MIFDKQQFDKSIIKDIDMIHMRAFKEQVVRMSLFFRQFIRGNFARSLGACCLGVYGLTMKFSTLRIGFRLCILSYPIARIPTAGPAQIYKVQDFSKWRNRSVRSVAIVS